MGVNIDSSNIRDLAQDFSGIPNRATREVGREVERVAKDGNKLAQSFARSSAGEHGKHYPDAFTVESAGGAFGLSWKYGPEAGLPQGGMSFEYGSRNQPPHLDLNRSADIVGPTLGQRVGEAVDRLFSG